MQYLQLFGKESPTYINPSLIGELLKLIMHNNVFMFGNSWWHQRIGTAMGTPCACIYATLFFSFYERTVILPKYKKHLLLYQRQIDNILGIWNPSMTTGLTFEDFVHDLNAVSKLNWETDNLCLETNFLDLTISINKNLTISTKTYQKPMNLHLYIPPHSAHPPGMVKSLV